MPETCSCLPTMSCGSSRTGKVSLYVCMNEVTTGFPPVSVAMATIAKPWRSYLDAENFRDTYLRLLPLLHFTYSAINPVAVKSLMNALGLPAGAVVPVLDPPVSTVDTQQLVGVVVAGRGPRAVGQCGDRPQ